MGEVQGAGLEMAPRLSGWEAALLNLSPDQVAQYEASRARLSDFRLTTLATSGEKMERLDLQIDAALKRNDRHGAAALLQKQADLMQLVDAAKAAARPPDHKITDL
jgi:hypothetical protein